MIEATGFLVTEGVNYPRAYTRSPGKSRTASPGTSSTRPETYCRSFEIIFEVLGGNRALGIVGDSLLAEVIEGEVRGSGRGGGYRPAPGRAASAQGDLGLALALLHLGTAPFRVAPRVLYRAGALW